MSDLPPEKIEKLQGVFDKLLAQNKKIRFMALVNKMGKNLVEKKQKGVKPLISKNKAQAMYMQLMLDITMRKELNPNMGKLKFIIAYRQKTEIITMPVKKYLVFISVQPDGVAKNIAKKTFAAIDKII